MSKTTPLIAITAHWDKNTGRYGVRRRYFDSLMEVGAMPVLLPVETTPEGIEEVLRHVDGVLLSGGEDIEPSLYGEARLAECGDACTARDATERALVQLCLRDKTPVFGICRGMQAMNAFSGGTLIQDIPSQTGSTLNHSQPDRYTEPVHQVRSLNSPLFEQIAGAKEIGVNTSHHQSCAKPGLGVHYIAESTTDQIIEALYFEGHPYALGVQWHPEMMAHLYPEHRSFFAYFVRACKGEFRIG